MHQALEARELEEVREEIGDLLFAVCNVARKCGVSPSEALEAATEKFERRFELVLDSVRASGHEPQDLSLDELEAHWQLAKRHQG